MHVCHNLLLFPVACCYSRVRACVASSRILPPSQTFAPVNPNFVPEVANAYAAERAAAAAAEDRAAQDVAQRAAASLAARAAAAANNGMKCELLRFPITKLPCCCVSGNCQPQRCRI